MIPDYVRIGQRIKAARLDKRLSQATLAEQVDLSVSYMSYIETGSRHISLTTLINVANALGVTVDHLLTGNQQNDWSTYATETASILLAATPYERQVMLETLKALKRILKESSSMLDGDSFD